MAAHTAVLIRVTNWFAACSIPYSLPVYSSCPSALLSLLLCSFFLLNLDIGRKCAVCNPELKLELDA